MKRALKVAGLTFLVVNVCWLALNYIAGSVPSTNEFLWFVENVNEEDVRIIWTNPFAVSRIPFDGIFIGFLGLIFYLVATTNKIQQDITGGLIFGLAFGLVGGLICGVCLAICLVVGVSVGLCWGWCFFFGVKDGIRSIYRIRFFPFDPVCVMRNSRYWSSDQKPGDSIRNII